MPNTGPAHPIRLERAARRWRARFDDKLIADAGDALVMHEGNLPPVVYFPRQDVAMEHLGRTERTTHCPFKGDACYFTLTIDGQIAENVAWSYEQPLEGVGPIAGRIAFYSDRVEVYDVDEAAQVRSGLDRREIDEAIQHTDAGDGTSQRERWPPNVEGPSAPDGAGDPRRHEV